MLKVKIEKNHGRWHHWGFWVTCWVFDKYLPAKTSTEQFVKLTNHYGVQNGIFGALEQSHSDSPIGSSFWQKYSLLQYTMTLLQGPKDPVFPTLLIILMPAAVSQFFLIWSTQIASTGNVNDVKLLYFGLKKLVKSLQFIFGAGELSNWPSSVNRTESRMIASESS